MTPRGTDWSLALLVALGVATGLGTWFAATPGTVWVYGAHAVAGGALAFVVVVKLRRVRVRAGLGVAALGLVAIVLGSGLVWSTAGRIDLGGYSLQAWHAALGAVLGAIVLAHALPRAKPLRRRDVRDRRQLIAGAGAAAGALVAWQVQRPLERVLALRGRERRFTGSYDAASFKGNDFPTTSWVADQPRPLSRTRYRLAVAGAVARPLSLPAAALDAGDELVATLDCTGGFFSTQRWRGVRIGRLLEQAGVAPEARHVRVISRTGYRWSFGVERAAGLLLATHVGGEPLTHAHGAPCRLVVPGRRGFQWVKWVDRIELHEDPDPGAPLSTLWSSLTAAGRGV